MRYVFIFLVLVASGLGATRYVSATAGGSGNGETTATPWTLAQSLAAAPEGHTIKVGYGAYTGDMLFNGGTVDHSYSSETIWIGENWENNANTAAVITSGTTSALYFLTGANSITNVTISNITFVPVSGDYGIFFRDNGDGALANIKVDNCTFAGANFDAIAVVITHSATGNMTGIAVEDCSFTTTNKLISAGTAATNASDFTFTRCTMSTSYNTTAEEAIDLNGALQSYYFYDCDLTCTGANTDYLIYHIEGTHLIVEGCSINFSGDVCAVQSYDPHTTNASPLGDITGNILYTNNRIISAASAIRVVRCTVPTLIYIDGNWTTAANYNIEVEGDHVNGVVSTKAYITNNRTSGGQYGIIAKTSDDCVIQNNFYYGDGGATDAGIYIKGGQDNLIKNNAAANCGYGVYLGKAAGNDTDWPVAEGDRNSTGQYIMHNALSASDTNIKQIDVNQTYTADFNCYIGNTEASGMAANPSIVRTAYGKCRVTNIAAVKANIGPNFGSVDSGSVLIGAGGLFN